MGQMIPNVDLVSMDILVLWQGVESAWQDDHVSDAEKAECRRIYTGLQLRARATALMQRVGLSVARLGRLDKNLVTEMRGLCGEMEVTLFEGAELSVDAPETSNVGSANGKAATAMEQALELVA